MPGLAVTNRRSVAGRLDGFFNFDSFDRTIRKVSHTMTQAGKLFEINHHGFIHVGNIHRFNATTFAELSPAHLLKQPPNGHLQVRQVTGQLLIKLNVFLQV